MKLRFVWAAAVLVAGTATAAVNAGADGGYLAVWEGRVSSEAGVVRELGDREYAFPSPDGDAFAVVALREGVMPLASSVTVYDGTGRTLWSLADSGATTAYVADSGAAVLVTRFYVDPKAPALLEFYSASGVKAGEAEVGPPLDAAFFPGQEKLALIELGGATIVFDPATGEEEYRLPAARTAAPGPGETVLLVGREWMALYRGATELWRVNHSIYFPRLAYVSADGARAVVGGHHEVVLVSLAEGRMGRRWEAPAGFALTDLAASPDFASFAVAYRSLDGVEAAAWLDEGFSVITEVKRNVARPSGSSPAVALPAGGADGIVVMGQGWHTTLTR
ncbi:MAG: hypothetical protein PVH29_01755 [Candidatus Zixiibacteriota bacterium]|jgi:hypothetical protein